eukprot:4125485-Pyramimonas_sp.AAC.1
MPLNGRAMKGCFDPMQRTLREVADHGGKTHGQVHGPLMLPGCKASWTTGRLAGESTQAVMKLLF